MRTIAVAVAIVSVCFMQDVSGNFLSATPAAKLHMTEEKDEKVMDAVMEKLVMDQADEKVKKKTEEKDEKVMDAVMEKLVMDQADEKLKKKVMPLVMEEKVMDKADAKVQEEMDIGDEAFRNGETSVMEKLFLKHNEVLDKLADAADELNKVAAQDGASDEAKQAAGKADKDLEEAEDKAAEALADEKDAHARQKASVAAGLGGSWLGESKAGGQDNEEDNEAEEVLEADGVQEGHEEDEEDNEADDDSEADEEDNKAAEDNEADEKDENEEDEEDEQAAEEAPEADKQYIEGDRLAMQKALKKLGARVEVLNKKAAKDGASDAVKLMAESDKKALEAASKSDQAMWSNWKFSSSNFSP